MRILNLFLLQVGIICLAACGTAGNSGNNAVESETAIENQDCTDVINTVYEKFVFAIDADPEIYSHPENYFTPNALKKLRDSYEFDCESNDCYAYYELRTREQDSKPGTEGESFIAVIENIGDGWYVVKYSDMGWSGMTRIKISEGKIEDFERCVEDF